MFPSKTLLGLLALFLGSSTALAQICTTNAGATPIPPDKRRAVVITDQAVIGNRFPFANTIGNLIATAGLTDTPAERVALVASMVRSFNKTSQSHPETGLPVTVDVRPGEAKLDPIKMLAPPDQADSPADSMRPVGLFNRLDLAPDDWRHCGEHRIVYAKKSGGPFFLIFEAAVENPDAAAGKAGCKPIADFWNSLSAETDPAKIGIKLEEFYFRGFFAPNGKKFGPVINFRHLGVPFGQVRGNFFLGLPWQLREWRVTLQEDGAPWFSVDTVKNNPQIALYKAPSPAGTPQDLLAREFQGRFSATSALELAAADDWGRSPSSTTGLISSIGVTFDNRYTGFQSNSDPVDDPLQHASAQLRQQIGALAASHGNMLTTDHLLARAGAMSCAGCHLFSSGKHISATVKWPRTAGGFVHISEQGVLSEALECHLLEARHAKLQTFFAPPPPPMAVLPRVTLGLDTEALSQLREIADRSKALEVIKDIDASVRTLRAEERRRPGAFVPRRSVH